MSLLDPPVIQQETLGVKLRRLAKNAQNNNVWTRPYMKAVPAWTTATAYRQGDVRSNAGNLYVAITNGTSGATAPTQTTGIDTSDGGVSWTYFAPNYITTDAADIPTYTYQTSVPSGLTNVYNPQTPLGFGAIKLRGCYNGGNFGSNFIRAWTFTPATGSTPSFQHCATEFYSDAPKLYIRVSNSGGILSVIIDGVRYRLSGSDNPSSALNFLVFDFSATSGRKVRHWRIEGGMIQGWNIGDIGVDSNSTVWAPDDTDKVTAIFISDSLMAGSGYGPFLIGNNVVQRVGHELGWSDPWSFTQGGTGYINRGTGAGTTTDKFGFRITEALTRNPDMWVLMGSTNDLDSGATAVTAAVLANLQTIRAGSSAPIVVMGLWPYDDSAKGATAKIAIIESAVQAAVTQFNDAKTFFIPIRNDAVLPWVTGTWNNTNNPNSTNKNLFISGDNTHPCDGGTAYLSRRIANAIRTLVLPNLK